MSHDSQIVIGPLGTVLAVSGDLPSGLLDEPLDACHGLPREVREAGKALLQELHASKNRLVSQALVLDGAERSVRIIAIEALAIRRKPADLPGLLRSKLGVLLSQAAGVGMILRVESSADVPSLVRVDSEKLAWAVTALVGNALRYMQPGSRPVSGGTIHVKVTFAPATSEVVVDVQDDGPGIPADTVDRLFKGDGMNVRGSGLSLLLISEIMAAHGGHVTVRSSTDRIGHGTTIRLTWPAR